MTTLLIVIAWILLGGWALAGIIQALFIAFVSKASEEKVLLLALLPVVVFNMALPITLLILAINLINTYVGA